MIPFLILPLISIGVWIYAALTGRMKASVGFGLLALVISLNSYSFYRDTGLYYERDFQFRAWGHMIDLLEKDEDKEAIEAIIAYKRNQKRQGPESWQATIDLCRALEKLTPKIEQPVASAPSPELHVLRKE